MMWFEIDKPIEKWNNKLDLKNETKQKTTSNMGLRIHAWVKGKGYWCPDGPPDG